MATITISHFDTLGYIQTAKRLETTEELAEFQARQIEQAIDVAVSKIDNKELATKADVTNLEKDLTNIFQKELIASELRLIKCTIGTGAATILAITGILKYLIH